MTKGALEHRYIPLGEDWHKSDLFYDLAKDFGSAGPLTWLILNLEWREPEAEITEQDGQRGLYRRVRLHYLLNLIPMDVGPKKVAAIILWLEDRKHLTIEDEDRANLRQIREQKGTCVRRAKHGSYGNDSGTSEGRLRDDSGTTGARVGVRAGTMVGLFWPKLLEFRERVLHYIKGKESKGLGPGSTEPNQDQIKPNFTYVRNPKTGEWDHVSIAEKELRNSIDD